MDNDQFELLLERLRPSEKGAFERHAQTALTSLIVMLLAGLAGFIISNDREIGKQTTAIQILQIQIDELSKDVRGANGATKAEVMRIEGYMNRLWPRYRALNENQTLLHRELQRLCGCEIELKKPEKF